MPEVDATSLRVGFVIATLNEEGSIGSCIASLQHQDYPAELIRIYVVDGGSDDATRSIIEACAREDERVVLLPNPGRIAACAFNIGARHATTDVISLVSAHSELEPTYARVLAEAFDSSGAMLVGGRMVARTSADSSVARSIVTATSSKYGLGNARFHYDDEPGWVDTAFPGAYRRELFDLIGGFDEELVRNQDDDFHFRARLAGYPMWFEPRLRSDYQPRSSFRALSRQYYEYGFWRARTMAKHRRLASYRQAAPIVLVAGLAAGPVVMPSKVLRRLWFAGATSYATLVLGAGFVEARRTHDQPLDVAAAVATLHVSYGAGFWVGAAAVARNARHGRSVRP